MAYLDNSATTQVCDEAVSRINYALKSCWGNPSSTHEVGLSARLLLDEARASAARSLKCDRGEIFFTSGGTESNNLALFGSASRFMKRKGRIVTSAVEHPSVLEAAKRLEALGFEVIYLGVDRNGVIRSEELYEAVNEKTVLVSVMAVNNETGAVQPIEKLRSAVRRSGSKAVVHVDAVQAFGKIPLNPRSLGIDLLSVSSHKIHGPKGCGLLYVAKGTPLSPVLYGGGQQNSVRPGTEAMPAIAGFGAAIDALPDINQQLKITSSLRNQFLAQLNELDFVRVNSPDDALPYIINISLEGMRSETLMNYLSERGICVSAGSACAGGHRSHVLEAMALPPERIDGALRVSLSRLTVPQELDALVKGLTEAREHLKR